jgi:stage V sporulation protein AA
MEIYIKPKKKAALVNREEILISDVAEIVAAEGTIAKIGKMKLASVDKREKNYLVSVTDIIKKISKAYPDATINNVGEMDTWVHCRFKEGKASSTLMWVRAFFVSLILMVGAATAIMSFHTDGQIPKVFERFHTMIFGVQQSNPPIIAIPYSIGLAFGIIIFYNHFFGKKITDDPTPIEVEMQTYDKEVTEAMVDMMETRERENG